MRFLLVFFLSFTSFVHSNDCPGLVTDKKYLDDTFTGKCDSNDIFLWGELDYGGDYVGHSYQGFFINDHRESGTYYWPDGRYRTGVELETPKELNGKEYDFVGTYQKADGSTHEGFFNGLEANGFGATSYVDEDGDTVWKYGTFITVDGKYELDGYGVTVINDMWGWGFFQSGSIVGSWYLTDDDFEDEVKYTVSNGESNGPYALSSADDDRLDSIMTFIMDSLDEYESYSEYHDARVDEYNIRIEEYNAFVNNRTNNNSNTESSDEFYENDLVKSIQELLAELGYSPGPADGIFGQRTKAAISAFQYELELDITGVPSEELLVALQLAIKYENIAENSYENSYKEEQQTQLIGSGTGFYINNDTIVTNFHVVDQCIELKNSNEEILTVIASDEKNDMAILNGPNRRNYLSVSSRNPSLGEKVYAAGFPLNSDLESFMITSGNVSSLNPGQDSTLFSITAPIQPGNSGGPILDRFGRVLGIVVSTLDADAYRKRDGYIPQNINFGIKNNVLKEFLNSSDINLESRTSYMPRSETSIADTSRESSELILCYGY